MGLDVLIQGGLVWLLDEHEDVIMRVNLEQPRDVDFQLLLLDIFIEVEFVIDLLNLTQRELLDGN